MFIPAFNTPEHRLNLYAAHRNIWDKMGFRIHYRWANSFNWNVNNYWVGRINSYGVFDAQVSFHVPQLNSQLKIGAANLLSREYQLGIGNGTIGGLYYVSLTFDKLLY